ncbi:hypothetical protein J2X68_002086 [Streptomyces sp. 3330]|uniref:hypothetical protein n=1 Tax=Streptomyces sp. 3330 TaxID=2817755 RepID=UPI00285BB978|nr:hypothetical protein [Streptomyces sp. 3330]MDR6975402.1 hypothetical protein [Streptomyces sp. 3330]
MGPGDESKAYGVDGDASDVRREQVIDWLEQASDLPHLIARVSELVLRLGHAPEDLVVLPRGELDRRELAAYSAGWADVVDEQLPAIRRAYEERITAAYLQGQEDARTGRRPRRARRAEGEREYEREDEHERGGEVIQLPYVELLRPPGAWTRVEERGDRERSVADGTPVPTPAPAEQSDVAEKAPYGDRSRPLGAPDGTHGEHGDPAVANVVRTTGPAGPTSPSSSRAGGPHDGDRHGGGAGGAGGPEPGSGAEGDILLSAREVRGKRVTSSDRRPVVRRNGRPSVPPLALPGEIGATGRERARRPDGTGTAERPPQERPERTEKPGRPERTEKPGRPERTERPQQTERSARFEPTDDVERSEPVAPVAPVVQVEPAEPDEPVEPDDPRGGRDEPKPRLLSDKARALADELEGRAGGRRRDERNGPPGSH